MLVRDRAAGVEVGVEGVEFLLHPANPGSDDQPAVGDHVQRAQHLGVQDGMTVGQHEHAETELQPSGDGRQVGQGCNRFQDTVGGSEREPAVASIWVPRTRFVGYRDVVAEEHAVVAQCLSAGGDLDQRIDVGQGADIGQYHTVFHTQNLRTEGSAGGRFWLTLRRTRC